MSRSGKISRERSRSAPTAGDRRSASQLKYVGGLLRPGTNLAMSEAELVALPGFSHDIAAARAAAKRLLAEAGVNNLTVNLVVRDIPIPHYAGADLLVASWQEIGVSTTQNRQK